VAIHEGEEYGFRGCFHEVRPNELIVQTFTFEAWRSASTRATRSSTTCSPAADRAFPREICTLVLISL
jgi:hypothetical protein